MDAAEADADIKLYKASAELLLELRAKIPRLVRCSSSPPVIRKWVLDSKANEVVNLLDYFQEWPQLLDPYIATLIQDLVEAYLTYCVHYPSEYNRDHGQSYSITPLPRAIARVLYAFCKVRGPKIIVRLLNNEPKYIEPLISCFRMWTSARPTSTTTAPATMTWEERYLLLLWLAHLLLAPFELSTISGLAIGSVEDPRLAQLLIGLPNISINLAMVGLDHLFVPSKAREAASMLLVRLALRSDMHRLGLTEKLVNWTLSQIDAKAGEKQATVYQYIGLLSLLFGIINSASDSEAAPFVQKVFSTAHAVATSEGDTYQRIRDSAPARKLLIKIMRSTVIHALAMPNGDLDLNAILEDCIQVMLDYLGDKDTPVRQAASKALSLICLKLDSDMSFEVVEATVQCLNENVLLEDVHNGKLFPITDMPAGESVKYKKNLNAVDPLKWHGAMLTLGHLLFRRSLPTSQLPAIIEVLLMGLNFEQRSNVGTSIGVGVRDAACFGVWSLARKYSTAELDHILIAKSSLSGGNPRLNVDHSSTLQLIATQLAVSACLDPSGNLRRGSSAALQELIGRHPDAIAAGIPVVQTVDYHAVARRSRAVTEVAVAASKLSIYYHRALLNGLLGWRGARATDADSRRQAAAAAGLLVSTAKAEDVHDFLQELVTQIQQLKVSNSGSNAAARHGLMLTLASAIDTVSSSNSGRDLVDCLALLNPILENMNSAIGNVETRPNTDIDNVLEATSTLIASSAGFLRVLKEASENSVVRIDLAAWTSSMLPILDRCTTASERDFVTDAASYANTTVLAMLEDDNKIDLISSWLDQKQQSRQVFSCRGRIMTLGRMFGYASSSRSLQLINRLILNYLSDIIKSSYSTETKVNAMKSVKMIISESVEMDSSHLKTLVAAIQVGLRDYTVDQRGDIGSLLRLESIEAAAELESINMDLTERHYTMQMLAKLAAEKMVKVRFQAWKCLESYLHGENMSRNSKPVEHQADVSSVEYFKTLLQLLSQPHMRGPLIIGLISSTSAGTEEVARASCEALIAFIQQHDVSAQQLLTYSIIDVVTDYAVNAAKDDDRDVVSATDFLAFLVEQILTCGWGEECCRNNDQLWDTCQTLQSPSASMMRLEALVRLCSSLTLIDAYRTRALDKLTRLLLHRWPKIRGVAADAVFFHSANALITMCDWNAPVAANKSTVLALRKELNVAGTSTAARAPSLGVAA